jgi:diaminopimelate epimerase
MRIRNSDGGEVEACGNGARCVASLVLAEAGREEITIETLAGVLPARRVAADRYEVAMGVPRFEWQEIPLAKEMDTLNLDLSIGPASRPVLSDPVALSIGNPHAVFFVDDVATVDIATVGPMLEHHPLFPERANIGFAQILGPDRLRLRVWERGAGLTQACGSGACAAAVAAARRDYTGREVTLVLDGGELGIRWREADGEILMTGPVATAFTGELSADLVDSLAEAAA